MSTTWFTAATRFGGEPGRRPWPTSAAHDAALIDNWNSRIDPDDVVWVLGDFATTTEGLDVARDLHGRKYLIAGLGDHCHHSRDHAPAWGSVYRRDAGFSGLVSGEAIFGTGAVVTIPIRDVFGARVLTAGLSCFPPIPDGTEADHYRPRKVAKRDLPPDVPATQPTYTHLVHGHVGNAWTVNGPLINVSVEVWDYAPVPADTLLRLMVDGMPDCECAGTVHPMGSPGCVLNES